jgi:hypothetical protein
MGVAAIASPIGLPDIRNGRLGMLVLSLEGSDKCVFSLDREHLGASLKPEPDRVFSAHDCSDRDNAPATVNVVHHRTHGHRRLANSRLIRPALSAHRSMPMLLGRGLWVESVSLYFRDHAMARLRKNDLVPIDFPEFVAAPCAVIEGRVVLQNMP